MIIQQEVELPMLYMRFIDQECSTRQEMCRGLDQSCVSSSWENESHLGHNVFDISKSHVFRMQWETQRCRTGTGSVIVGRIYSVHEKNRSWSSKKAYPDPFLFQMFIVKSTMFPSGYAILFYLQSIQILSFTPTSPDNALLCMLAVDSFVVPPRLVEVTSQHPLALNRSSNVGHVFCPIPRVQGLVLG